MNILSTNIALTEAADSTTKSVLVMETYPQEHDITDSLFSLGLQSFAIAVIAIFAIYVILWNMDRYYNWSNNRRLTISFAIVWFFGFVVYDVGMYTGNPWSLVGNSPMAILHAFGMFILDSDVSAIHDELHGNWIYMFFFSAVHISAAVISLLFVIKHFGFNIVASFKMFWARHTTRKTLYVFWGMNSATYYLAKSIKEHHKSTKDNNYRIVVVRTNNDGESTGERNEMPRLFSFISLKNRDLARLKELDCLTTNTFSSPAALDIPKEDIPGSIDILGKRLGLKGLRKIISKKTTGRVHMFFLSENEGANILAVANMKLDNTINNLTDNQRVTLYCRARYNSVHRVIEDAQINPNVNVRVVDSSHMSVELLKRNIDLQPVNYVKIEPDATVSSEFNALVIGFGNVGLDTVRFLYEFGAFVRTGSTDDCVMRSKFHCDVVDKNMVDLAGLFIVNAPTIKPAMPFIDGRESESSLIVLHRLDCQSAEFYKRIEDDWIRKLNYVVLTLDDTESNISLAIRIFRLAIRYRKNLDNFRIMVYVPNDEGGHASRIIEHYNRLWASENHKNNNLKQNTILKGHIAKRHRKNGCLDDINDINSPISLFGLMENTYTYECIIDNSLIEEAKKYKAIYDTVTKSNAKDWEENRLSLMQLNPNEKEYLNYSPTFSGMAKLFRTEVQNICNSLHKNTKIRLAESAFGDTELVKKLSEAMTNKSLLRKPNTTKYYWSGERLVDGAESILKTLAQTEHLRWNASHEILGYRLGDNRDEARLLHNCLRPWQDLTEQIQSYDCDVVDVSLNIYNEKL
ncbi:MAG: hypothetical protein IK120_04320 [Muribaculaceae bacterium]|nr:hypothetical protein [Muribaculaceae bacterium]